jgi:hypothetical protein
MRAITQGYGQLYNQLGQYCEKAQRDAGWMEKLLSNEKGLLTNNTSGTLHYEDHKRMLDDVDMVRQYSSTLYDVLVAAPGVAVNVSLFETLIGSQNMNAFNAQTSMNVSDRQSQQTDYAFSWVPQPIYHADFHIPWRQAGHSYKQGDGAAEAAIAVRLERDEVLVLGDSSISVDVNGVAATLAGLTNASATLLQPGSMTNWALASSVALVYPEAVDLLATMFTTDRAAQTPNSVIMIVANDIWPQLELVNNAGNSERTNLERLKALSAIKDVMPNQFLAAGSVLLIEVTPTSIRIPRSAEITIAPWQRKERFEDTKFTTFSSSTLQVRGDRNGRSGVSFATKA